MTETEKSVHITKTRCGNCRNLQSYNQLLDNKTLTYYRCPNNSKLDYVSQQFADRCSRFIPKRRVEGKLIGETDQNCQ